MSVDEMARVASTALHAATEPVRPIDFADRRRPSRQPQLRLRLAVGLGAVAAAIIAVVVIVSNRDDGTRVATTPKDVPRLILGTVPDGLQATGAADLPVASAPDDPTISYNTTLYGDEQTAAWLKSNSATGVGKRLLVLEASISGSNASTGLDGDAVVVNGHEWFAAPLVGEPSLATIVDERSIILSSPGLDGAALVQLAQAVSVVDGAIRVDASSGLRTLARSTMPPSFILTTGRGSGGTVGHVAGYQDGGDGNDVVMVSTIVASADDLAVLRAEATKAEPVTVRGHDGWAITRTFDDGTAFRSLAWFELDGVLATVSGTRPIAELRSMAESLVVADDATWAELSQPLGVVADGTTVIGSGDLDGHAWRVTYSSDQGLCLEVQEDAQGSSSSCGDASVGASSSSPIGDGTITYRVETRNSGERETTDCNGEPIRATITNGDVVPGAVVAVYVLNDCRQGIEGVPTPESTIADGREGVSVSRSSSGPATSLP